MRKKVGLRFRNCCPVTKDRNSNRIKSQRKIIVMLLIILLYHNQNIIFVDEFGVGTRPMVKKKWIVLKYQN